MRHWNMIGAACAAVVLASASPVAAAENLDCMDSGYDASSAAVIDTFVAAARADNMRELAVAELDVAIALRARQCADLRGWSDAAAAQAVRYRTGAIILVAFRRNAPIDAAAIGRMDAVIDGADRALLTRTVETMQRIGAGGAGEPSADELALIREVVAAPQVAMTTEIGRFIGSWMAARVVSRDAATQFATL